MDHDQDGPAIVSSHCNPSILFPAMIFIKDGDGMWITQDRCRSLEAHLVLAEVLFRFRFRWAPLTIVMQWQPRSFRAPETTASSRLKRPLRETSGHTTPRRIGVWNRYLRHSRAGQLSTPRTQLPEEPKRLTSNTIQETYGISEGVLEDDGESPPDTPNPLLKLESIRNIRETAVLIA
jgi:hypothetical protein